MRTTLKELEAIVNRINGITNSPLEAYTMVDGKYVANVGNYHLDGAYGGYKLSRMCNEGGGVSDVLSCGFTTKRDLASLMHSFIRGLEAKN